MPRIELGSVSASSWVLYLGSNGSFRRFWCVSSDNNTRPVHNIGLYLHTVRFQVCMTKACIASDLVGNGIALPM